MLAQNQKITVSHDCFCIRRRNTRYRLSLIAPHGQSKLDRNRCRRGMAASERGAFGSKHRSAGSPGVTMDLGAWTLRGSVAEPQGLFEAQIAGAEHLLGQIAAADVFADLAPVRKELSV